MDYAAGLLKLSKDATADVKQLAIRASEGRWGYGDWTMLLVGACIYTICRQNSLPLLMVGRIHHEGWWIGSAVLFQDARDGLLGDRLPSKHASRVIEPIRSARVERLRYSVVPTVDPLTVNHTKDKGPAVDSSNDTNERSCCLQAAPSFLGAFLSRLFALWSVLCFAFA